MRTTSYLHGWEFPPGRGDYSLSDASRLTISKLGVVRLRLQQRDAALPGRPARYYPASGNDYVRTGAFAPSIRTGWGFLEVVGEQPLDGYGAAVTSLDCRLHNGTSSVYWDGSGWVAAGAGDWNTQAEVNAHLPAFTGASLAVEVRLRTTNETLSPALLEVRLKWTGRMISPLKEWVYGSVVQSMLDSIRPITDYVIELGATGSSFALADYPLDAGFDLTNVLEVYNHTADPSHEANLLASYAGGTVTLTAPVAAGQKLWLVATYRPQVAVTTDPDFTEQAKAPAICFTSVRVPTSAKRTLGVTGPHAIDRTGAVPAGTVYAQPITLHNIDFTLATVAPTALDLLRLNAAVADWMAANPTLRSPAYDLRVRLEPGSSLEWGTDLVNVGDPRQAAGSFRLVNVPWFADSASADAAGSGSARLGAIDAGDPAADGIGYGVKGLQVSWSSADGPGTDSQEIN